MFITTEFDHNDFHFRLVEYKEVEGIARYEVTHPAYNGSEVHTFRWSPSEHGSVYPHKVNPDLYHGDVRFGTHYFSTMKEVRDRIAREAWSALLGK